MFTSASLASSTATRPVRPPASVVKPTSVPQFASGTVNTGATFSGPVPQMRQLLTPVDLNTLLLLREAGWEMDDIFRIFVNSINGIPNASTGASSTPEGVPVFEDFLAVVEAMDELEDDGSLIMARSSSETSDQLALRVKPEARSSQDFLHLSELLNLDPEAEYYRVKLGFEQGGDHNIIIQTRSTMAAMFYVGQAVRVPEQLMNTGVAHVNTDESGRPFDWRVVHSDLINIYSSAKRPDNAFVAVTYKDYWYYIENSDIDSKETLTMLSIVFTLTAGSSSGTQAPVLTIPVD